MMRVLGAAVLLAPTLAGGQAPAESDSERRAVAIDAAVRAIAHETALWPGYEPDRIPLAIFTGDRTFLFRHPSPPADFVVRNGVGVMPGRHPAVTSNSSATIGDIATATLLADGARRAQSARTLAAVALHEAFHVHQRAHHPGWSGNEGDLFTYPVDRVDLLVERRLETEHLRRALGSSGAARACHGRRALTHRAARFGRMLPAHVEYERRSELNEGLATYVQLLAGGERTVDFPQAPFAPDAVRDRFYVVGPAWALLLDDAAPGWQAELVRHDSLALDALLDRALPPPDKAGACDLSAGEREAITTLAGEAVAAVAGARAAKRAAFERPQGWRLTIEAAPGAHLWPQGFDPLNVTMVADGLLHDRFLTLGNDAGRVAMVDGEGADLTALTVAVGDHPLFSGVRQVTITGLGAPEVRNHDATLEITAPGLTARFRGATLLRGDRSLHVRLGAAADPE